MTFQFNKFKPFLLIQLIGELKERSHQCKIKVVVVLVGLLLQQEFYLEQVQFIKIFYKLFQFNNYLIVHQTILYHANRKNWTEEVTLMNLFYLLKKMELKLGMIINQLIIKIIHKKEFAHQIQDHLKFSTL